MVAKPEGIGPDVVWINITPEHFTAVSNRETTHGTIS
jgi:hypothetical protein